ncbi:MAG TPA: calcium-binding protein, partial [Acidimicrobiaceae bacterium]|nr:calcium-binding protein [Acidimicrobiaceae bacterium]
MKRLFVVLAAFAMVASACGSDDGDSASGSSSGSSSASA